MVHVFICAFHLSHVCSKPHSINVLSLHLSVLNIVFMIRFITDLSLLFAFFCTSCCQFPCHKAMRLGTCMCSTSECTFFQNFFFVALHTSLAISHELDQVGVLVIS